MSTIDKTQYTPMMRQYLTIKEDYNDAIVFFRLGDFYEMFFQDAYVASKELEIQLTGRDAGADERVPMCGVPHHSAESYIETLIEKGYKVAICEQVEDAASAKGLVKRDVVRLITPGTFVEHKHDELLYLAAVGIHMHNYTISYIELSTGDSYSISVPKDYNILLNELQQIHPKELVISGYFDQSHIASYIQTEDITLSIHNATEVDDVFDHLYEHLPSKEEQKTYKRLLSYITETQKRQLLHVKACKVLEASSYLKMDANTFRNLELTTTLRQNNRTGTLFWLMDKCVTAMGSRFLKKSILRPLINKDVLETRYDTIDVLNTEFITKQDIKDELQFVYDLERIVGRISYGNANAKDVVQLRRSISVLPKIKQLLLDLNNAHTSFLANSLHTLDQLHTVLDSAIVEDPPLSITEGGIIKEGYHAELDAIKQQALNIKSWLDQLQTEEREKTGIKKLKIGYNRVFGYYIEVPKGQIKNIKDEFGYTRKQTLANSERYITEELKEKEKIILTSEEKSIALEYDLFVEIRNTLQDYMPKIQKNADIISELDMMVALSTVSETYHFIRPTLTTDKTIDITESKHPVVEEVLIDDVFVPNDITMDKDTDILLITGPNMSGKSTYMRQLALTVILAQIGSFVPAKKATLSIFDAIFTRIGAADDLVSGKSTFMVEMLDANRAIRFATENSLILFDEMGRGTATYDGMALAQAIIEYIHETIHCKTLFSTHYHELTVLDQSLNRLKNIHVSARDEDGQITFLHKVKEGPTDKSYGINVASLAELPQSIIKRSNMILQALEERPNQPRQLNLFNFEQYDEQPKTPNKLDKVKEELGKINIDEITPLEALNVLHSLLQKL